MSKSPLSTHILDTSSGRPGSGILIELSRKNDDSWQVVNRAYTDQSGRYADFGSAVLLSEDTYKLRFYSGEYYREKNIETLYPYVDVIFNTKANEHYHIPLLISPYGYSTYRGS